MLPAEAHGSVRPSLHAEANANGTEMELYMHVVLDRF